MNSILREIYYSAENPAGYRSQRKLYLAAKKINPKITLKTVKKWWEGQRVPSRFSQASKKFPRAIFKTHGPNVTFLADLADFKNLQKSNKKYRYLLVVQDLFSRKLMGLVAQKTKTAFETSESFKKIFAIQAPKKLLTDFGGEFLGASNKAVYRTYSVHHYVTNDVTQKVAPVERCILVVKQKLYRIMASENSGIWIDKLQAVMESYNDSHNRFLGMTPNEAYLKKNKNKVYMQSVSRKEAQNLAKKIDFKFKIGDIVRIQKDQSYAKSYTGNYSSVLYNIVNSELKGGVPVYKIRELLTNQPVIGIFYANELKRVNIDVSKLPEIDRIYSTRWNNDIQEVNVSYKNSSKKLWVPYDALIPYKL